jgi:hypothetical protein
MIRLEDRGSEFLPRDPVWDEDSMEWLVPRNAISDLIRRGRAAGLDEDSVAIAVSDMMSDEFLARAKKSTMLRNYALRFVKSTMRQAVRNTLPWHAQAEREMAVVGLADLGRRHTQLWIGDPRRNNILITRHIGITGAISAAKAQVYLWDEKILETVDACPVPRHTITRADLPYPIMFWSYENSRRGTINGKTYEVNWFMVSAIADKILFYHDLTPPDDSNEYEVNYILQNYVDFGSVYPDDFQEGLDRQAAGQVIARLAFLNSPYVNVDRQPLSRDLRRQGNPVVGSVNDCKTNVVLLRREAREAIRQEDDDIRTHGTPSHHWWVSGHIRNQPYPSEGVSRLIWIAPYLKGNLRGPLLEKVYAVRR